MDQILYSSYHHKQLYTLYNYTYHNFILQVKLTSCENYNQERLKKIYLSKIKQLDFKCN